MSDSITCLENLFLGLGDKTRLRLLSLMADGPVPVNYLVEKTGDSQPKISRHLSYLRNAGLVETRRDGKWIYYGVAEQQNRECDSVLKEVLDQLGAGGSEQARLITQPAEPGLSGGTATETMHDASIRTEPQPIESSHERPGELEIFLL